MDTAVADYNASRKPCFRALCDQLAEEIGKAMPAAENRIWHAHPVWFLDGNPIVGYSEQMPGIRLMFWSGASFDEPALNVAGMKFKDASIFFREVSEIDRSELGRWLRKAQLIQWDYKNLVKRKGQLVPIDGNAE